MAFREFLEFRLLEVGDYSISVYSILLIISIFAGVKVLLFFIRKGISRRWKVRHHDPGSQFAIIQIISYVIWILAFVLALESMGVKITILIAGSAALLVGVGLGLQQTFNDIVSGIILLVEGSTKVGDVLDVDGEIVKLQNIGLRASKVINRDDIVIIIPNSMIVTNKVINWTHQLQETRFRISVGVAYGSDIDLVIQLLEKSALEHPACSKTRLPDARFVEFGDSSLNFIVLFWSNEMFTIERSLSDIRRTIDRKFRENGITIPFPQRDLHIKSGHINLEK
ncbi:MAG: mechanosensitive ion channel [Saprospiraceae bacterium]|nr:mechanosensitive ion channel [Saprospiraceae bacterium]